MRVLDRLGSIAHDLEVDGYSVNEDLFDPDLVAALAALAKQRHRDGQLIAAGTGKARHLDPSVRGDAIGWLESNADEQPIGDCLAVFEELRNGLNERLFLNLYDLESHFALYEPGTGYQKHLDQFATSKQRRQLSLVLYLNTDWVDTDGGELRLYLDGDNGTHLDLFPIGGRLVLFESSRFWHEVRPGTRDRRSIAGWFRTRR